ncbi:hypothetical protein K502DRAFT_363666 [Neoconidiobolus thromboides FSU 785]|nr:hypothetical protein K502DRAFT_363666 [Neoconidiobolus thromboides FSU 785]
MMVDDNRYNNIQDLELRRCIQGLNLMSTSYELALCNKIVLKFGDLSMNKIKEYTEFDQLELKLKHSIFNQNGSRIRCKQVHEFKKILNQVYYVPVKLDELIYSPPKLFDDKVNDILILKKKDVIEIESEIICIKNNPNPKFNLNHDIRIYLRRLLERKLYLKELEINVELELPIKLKLALNGSLVNQYKALQSLGSMFEADNNNEVNDTSKYMVEPKLDLRNKIDFKTDIQNYFLKDNKNINNIKLELTQLNLLINNTLRKQISTDDDTFNSHFGNSNNNDIEVLKCGYLEFMNDQLKYSLNNLKYKNLLDLKTNYIHYIIDNPYQNQNHFINNSKELIKECERLFINSISNKDQQYQAINDKVKDPFINKKKRIKFRNIIRKMDQPNKNIFENESPLLIPNFNTLNQYKRKNETIIINNEKIDVFNYITQIKKYKSISLKEELIQKNTEKEIQIDVHNYEIDKKQKYIYFINEKFILNRNFIKKLSIYNIEVIPRNLTIRNLFNNINIDNPAFDFILDELNGIKIHKLRDLYQIHNGRKGIYHLISFIKLALLIVSKLTIIFEIQKIDFEFNTTYLTQPIQLNLNLFYTQLNQIEKEYNNNNNNNKFNKLITIYYSYSTPMTIFLIRHISNQAYNTNSVTWQDRTWLVKELSQHELFLNNLGLFTPFNSQLILNKMSLKQFILLSKDFNRFDLTFKDWIDNKVLDLFSKFMSYCL